MSKVTFNFRLAIKQLYIQESMSTTDLSKLLRTVFKINSQILGITDQFGKFYDLNYSAEHIKTLNNHTFSIVTVQDAMDKNSFKGSEILKNETSSQANKKCLGIISDIQKFKLVMPEGIVILITLNDGQQIGDTPFYYYLCKGNKRELQIWKDRVLVIQCEIGKDFTSLMKGVSLYLNNDSEKQQKLWEKNEIVDIETKKTMILEAFDEIYRDGIITQLEFYKKKVILFEKPQLYIKKYLSGETMDRSLLFEVIRADVVKTRDQARVFGQLSSEVKDQIPIIVRKGTNVIQKVTTEHTLTVQQEQILNLLLELELKGLITETQMEQYQKHLLNENKQLFELFKQYLSKEIDQIVFTKQLRRLFRNRKSQKKLILT